MIRHEDIGTNNPMRSVTPKVAQYLMSPLTFEPGDSVLGADRQEYEIVFVNGIHRRMVGIFSSRRRFDDGGLVFDGHAVRSDDRLDCCVQTNYFRRTGYARTLRPRVPACQETCPPGNHELDANRRARIPTGRVCTNVPTPSPNRQFRTPPNTSKISQNCKNTNKVRQVRYHERMIYP